MAEWATWIFRSFSILRCQAETSAPYEFIPYKFGAFSFTSYADRRKLVDRRLLADEENFWTLTDTGRDSLGSEPDAMLAGFVAHYGGLRGEALVADTYRRFPYYATRSEIANKVMRGDPAALDRIAEARPTQSAGLATIGYEGLSLEGYLNKLLGAGVTILCDVRRNPLSRKYGFSKRTLAKGCDGVGIRYEHIPELGIDSIERRDLNTQADYDALFDRYERDLLPKQMPAIALIAGWLQSGESVALTCYEHLPAQCHRHCVAEAVANTMHTSLVQHL